jgi:hypothetical protein
LQIKENSMKNILAKLASFETPAKTVLTEESTLGQVKNGNLFGTYDEKKKAEAKAKKEKEQAAKKEKKQATTESEDNDRPAFGKRDWDAESEDKPHDKFLAYKAKGGKLSRKQWEEDKSNGADDVNESAGATKFGVYMSGGSVGEKNDAPKKTFDSKEEAIAFAKRRNSQLTPGERGYYKMKYTVRPVKAEPVDEAKNTPWPKNQALKKPMTDADHKAWQQQQKDEKKAASLARKKANESTGELDEAVQDLTKIPTERLKAYIAKHSGGGVPTFGTGGQIKRAQAELKRRGEVVKEEQVDEAPSAAALGKAAEDEFNNQFSPRASRSQTPATSSRKVYIVSKTSGKKVGGPYPDFRVAQSARAKMQDAENYSLIKETKTRKLFKVIVEGVQFNVSDSGLAKVLRRFPHETAKFKEGGDLADHLYDALYDHYCNNGEMPYGTMKARDGDPYEWVTQRLDRELSKLGLDESDGNVNPELQAILKKYPHEAKQFEEFGELDDGPMYEEFFDHYLHAGEMPYGVAKARTGDPVQWVAKQLEQDLGLNPENPDPGYMDSAEELSSHERYEPPMEGMGGDMMPQESIGEDSLDPTPDDGTVIVEGLEKVVSNILTDAGFDEGLDFFFENGLVVIGKSTAVAVMNLLRSNPQISSQPTIESMDGEEVRISFGGAKELGEGLADDFAAMANNMKNPDGSKRFATARVVTPQQKQDERAALDAKRAADAAARPPVAPGPDTTNNGSFGDNRGYGQGRYMGDSKINKGNMLNESKAKTRQQKVDCPECNGTGKEEKKSYNNMQAQTCSHCGGSGKVNPKVNEDANMNLSVSGTDDVLAVLRKLSGLDDAQPAMGGMDAAPEDDMMGMDEPQAAEPSMRDMMGMMDGPSEDPAMDAEPEMGAEPELAPEVPSEEPAGDMEMSAEPEVEVEEDYANEPHEKILPGYGTARGDKDGQGRRYPMTNPGNNPMANESKTAQLMRDYQTMLKGMKAK